VTKLTTLGIDLGTNSLGWCLIEMDDASGKAQKGRIVDIGTRIFSASDMAGRDAKSKESLAVARRQARAMRRQRDRRLRRKSRLLGELTGMGLMPGNRMKREKLKHDTDDGRGGDLSNGIYALRSRALDEALSPHELGWVLFQMNQRRGFKSNRKTDSRDNEAGKIAVGVSRLHSAMSTIGARTFGEFLHMRRLAGHSVRTRLRPEAMAEFDADPDARGEGYVFYPTRAELEDEFDAIMKAQAAYHPSILTDKNIAALRHTILFQRPLLAPKVGKCSYNPAETRLPKAHPLFQQFRLYKEVNELALIGADQNPVKLTKDQRDILVLKLRGAKTASFSSLRKLLKLGPEYHFNKETDNRTKLEGDVVTAALSHKDCFGPGWATKSIADQWTIIEQLRDEVDPDALREWLEEQAGLHGDRADAVMKVSLPEGYGRLGQSALTNLLDVLKRDTDGDGHVVTEAAAAQKVYGRTNAQDDPDRKAAKYLPKYQEVLTRHIPPGEGSISDPPDDRDPIYDRHMGRITNPTVHIALNQLRRVVNAILRKHGLPDYISIELGRELKLTDRQRDEVNQTIGKNTRDAQRRSDKLIELGQPDTGYNRLRLKLWEELNPNQPLNRICVYSGEPISVHQIFSSEVDVDHILPYSKTLDDGQGNKLLCFAHANRVKRNRAPADVGEWNDSYDEILSRVANLPKNKQWRFARGAMEHHAAKGDFAARQLTDMQYVSRMALSYLAALYPAEQADAVGVLRHHNRIRALRGRMTEMLRRKWALNDILYDHNITGSNPVKPKNRKDHRHHAIDAFVIACTSRSLIQKIASAAEEIERQGTVRVLSTIPEPWPGFRDQLRDRIIGSVVSHKPDHGTVSRSGDASGRSQTAGRLHNDTAYGLTGETDAKGSALVVHRVPLGSFRSEKDLAAIRDVHLRETLRQATRGLSGKAFENSLRALSRADRLNGSVNPYKGLRRVRIVEPLQVIAIRDRSGRAYKGYKGDSNHRFDVWQLPDGKWVAEVVSTFDAHQPDWSSTVRNACPIAKKVLSLHQNDMVAIERDGERQICRVVKFGSNGQITLAAHHEAGALKSRDADKADPFKYVSPTAGGLKKLQARQCRVDELGQIFDPGPRN